MSANGQIIGKLARERETVESEMQLNLSKLVWGKRN